MAELQYPLNVKHEPHIQITTREYKLPLTDNSSSEIVRGKILGQSYFYIPSSLTNAAGTNWVPEDINSVLQELAGGSKTDGSFKDTVKRYLGAAGKDAMKLLDTIAPGTTSNVTKNVGALGGQLLKPNSILILNNIVRYSLNLTFELTPQTPEEGQMVMNILTQWKKWSLPTLATDNLRMWLDYPPIFDINIKTTSSGSLAVSSKSLEQTQNMFAYENMVLENFSATTNGGQNESLFYEDGTPITTTLNLLFKSLKPGWNLEKGSK